MVKRVVFGVVVCLILSILVVSVSAEKIDIEIGNNYIPGEDVNFKLTLYGDENNKIEGEIGYVIQNYYIELIKQGVVHSGEPMFFKLSEDAVQGPWKIIANYEGVEVNQLFNIGDSEKAEIVLQGDNLIITNLGNTAYNKKILIYIGEFDQTADIYLDLGQTKRIRLTAPEGNYDIRVIEGNEEQVLEFNDVALTGNVIGLESIFGENGFWKRYPIVGVFLVALLIVIGVVGTLKVIKH